MARCFCPGTPSGEAASQRRDCCVTSGQSLPLWALFALYARGAVGSASSHGGGEFARGLQLSASHPPRPWGSGAGDSVFMHLCPPPRAPDLGSPHIAQACRTVFVGLHVWGHGHTCDSVRASQGE